MRYFAAAVLCLLPFLIAAQTSIEGVITNAEGDPLPFANVYLDEIYDGGATDEQGRFSFPTDARGEVVFVASSLGYESLRRKINIGDDAVQLNLVLQSAASELNEVVIAAGAFEASDARKATILKPLDIVQNPVAAGDLFGAIQTLPGVTQVGDETGIFVRGGEASETRTLIDGTVVDQPFFNDVPDIPSRGRFNPFLFQGTLFSTGGYSAEYGQAMSSVLVLNTQDMPPATATGVGLNLVGATLSHTQLWNDTTAFLASVGYTNLTPYFKLIRQRSDWETAPNGVGGALGYRHLTRTGGIWKSYLQYQGGSGALNLNNINDMNQPIPFSYDNDNWYTNTSYRGIIAEKWSFFTAVAASRDVQDIAIDQSEIEDDTYLVHGKMTLGRELGEGVFLRFGSDVQWREEYGRFETFDGMRSGWYGALYAETDMKLSSRFGMRLGLRAEREGLIAKSNLAPRVSLAYKTGDKSQVSFAYGLFYQVPEADFQRLAANPEFERATHYILNYQYISDTYTFRIEAYHKDYDNLMRYVDDQTRMSDGDGFARGVDVFWRDQKSVDKLDYWISYSYIDAERYYREFPESVVPRFITNHTLNVVSRYSLTARVRFGVGYTYASGRPFDDPNTASYLDMRTKPYHNASFNASYLTTLFGQFTVVYAAIRNPFNIDQVFDYQYSDDGSDRIPVGPQTGRSAFIGMFVSFQ